MNKINQLNLVARFNAKMLAKLGMNENEANLLAIGASGGDVEEIKDEIQTESLMIAEEAKDFVPIQYVLDDFQTGQTFPNIKDDFLKSSIDKNPVHRQVKPRIGKMVICRETGERKIIHEEEKIIYDKTCQINLS
jgi:hypothetical protein